MPHDHNHQHVEGCAHESTDSDYLKEIGIQYSLFKKIDVDNLECLNETVDGSAKFIFKPYEERLNFDKVSVLQPFPVKNRNMLNFVINSLLKVMPMRNSFSTFHSPVISN